jgi:hypothetical protein
MSTPRNIQARMQQAEVILNHDNENVRYIGQCEARHRRYKRRKLGGGQACDRSGDYTTAVAKAAVEISTAPGLTRGPVYIVYTFITFITCKIINIFYIMASDLLLQTMTLTKDRPVLSSERAPHKDKTVTVKQY